LKILVNAGGFLAILTLDVVYFETIGDVNATARKMGKSIGWPWSPESADGMGLWLGMNFPLGTSRTILNCGIPFFDGWTVQWRSRW